MSLLQVLMWGVWYPLKLQGLSPTPAYIAIGALAIVLFVSPIIHKDTFYGFGMGHPRYVFQKIKEGGKPRTIAISVLVFFMLLGAVAFFFLWKQLADALFNMNETDALAFRNSVGGTTAVIGMGIGAGFLVATFLIRYDNFLNSLKVALIVIAVLGSMLVSVGVLIDPTGLTRFDLENFALNFAGYIFWGALQQFLFAGYFGSRFRKAYGPAIDAAIPGSPTKVEEKAMRKKRFWVALLAGSYFGLIHVPSWSLVGFTCLLGVVLSWFYMKDKNRNLLAMGIIHGCLGSLANVFYEGSVSFSVGPSTDAAIALAPYIWVLALGLAIHQAIFVIAWWLSDSKKVKSVEGKIVSRKGGT